MELENESLKHNFFKSAMWPRQAQLWATYKGTDLLTKYYPLTHP